MEQTIQLQQQIMDKVQPCIRRDCNYYNIDKIKRQSEWDEAGQKWQIPELVVEKTTLPGGVMPGARGGLVGQKPAPAGRKQQVEGTNGDVTANYFDGNDDDKFRKHLDKNANVDFSATYFKSKRADKLLQGSSTSIELARKRDGDSQQRLRSNDSIQKVNGSVTPPAGPKNTLPRSLDPLPRPTKLESLLPSAFQKKKKKKTQGND